MLKKNRTSHKNRLHHVILYEMQSADAQFKLEEELVIFFSKTQLFLYGSLSKLLTFI